MAEKNKNSRKCLSKARLCGDRRCEWAVKIRFSLHERKGKVKAVQGLMVSVLETRPDLRMG